MKQFWTSIRKAQIIAVFWSKNLKFMRPTAISALVNLTRSLSYLQEQKFKYSFQNPLKPIWNWPTCGLKTGARHSQLSIYVQKGLKEQ